MNCPECGGPALYNWVLRHANACTIRAAEDATQCADRERIARAPWGFERPATSAELTLLAAAGHAPAPGPTTLVTRAGYRRRVIDGHDSP